MSVAFTLAPSRLLAAAIGGLHALTLIPLWMTIDDVWIAALLSTAIVAHAAWCVVRDAWLRVRQSVTAITIGDEPAIELTFRDGRKFAGTLDSSTVVTGRVAIVVVRGRQVVNARRAPPRFATRRAVVVVHGMLDADAFRRLRVLLRWGRADVDSSAAGARPPQSLQSLQSLLNQLDQPFPGVSTARIGAASITGPAADPPNRSSRPASRST